MSPHGLVKALKDNYSGKEWIWKESGGNKFLKELRGDFLHPNRPGAEAYQTDVWLNIVKHVGG